jgi:hypothetical protein
MRDTPIHRHHVTPPPPRRGDMIAVRCTTTQRLHQGRVDGVDGSIVYVTDIMARMTRSVCLKSAIRCIDYSLIEH